MGQFPEAGFSHPFCWIHHEGHRALFIPRCLDEQTIEKISAAIRAKPDWQRKSEDETIVNKWREELKGQAPVMPPPSPSNLHSDYRSGYFSDGEEETPKTKEYLIDYALSELEYYKMLEKRFGGGKFCVGVDEHVFVGENPVDERVKSTLRELVVKYLEKDPKDWHPGSSEQVLDLVHPSLYPLQYNLTPVLPEAYGHKIGVECGFDRLKDSAPLPPYNRYRPYKRAADYGISERFQWLPAIFDVNTDGKVEVMSYINNLHPNYHRELYEPIARVFEHAIPGINGALSVYANPQRIRIQPLKEPAGKWSRPEPIYTYPKDCDEVIQELGEETFERLQNEGVDSFRLQGEPVVNKPEWKGVPDVEPVDIRDSRLKVIVKLANIHLTPDKPDYAGGSWHVEGTINEDIVATVLYYYDSENITASHLALRVAQEEPKSYEQGDYYGVRKVYGIRDDEPIAYNVGSIPCREDSIVVFPNCFQHQVQPFSLADPTKPGHRKILCFFICDPTNNMVVASDRVPAQQREWWTDEITKTNSLNLPAELTNNILSKVDWPKDIEYAKKIRKDLMQERSSQVEEDQAHAFFASFSLCEH
ncbi:hypothetical protein TRICI_003147 [Trichomonascus ciferrii]|uniref:Uncharacterized protein n=1 Tax=Trichomonascus ciferrii TaxID=44093 RepID=A0A642V5Y1_9ASCO|nr:hypothetical protein TRICI_003147 [Trichomonascus ciferrii]